MTTWETSDVTVHQASSTKEIPDDPVGVAVAEFVGELLGRATIELHYSPVGESQAGRAGAALPAASGDLLEGWRTTLVIRLDDRVARVVTTPGEPLTDLPAAALRAGHRFRNVINGGSDRLSPSLRRALRDTVAIEFLILQGGWAAETSGARLIADTVEYLIELSGTRIESQNPTHGVVITDAIRDAPRLSIPYPAGLRQAKRSPLLFDGQRSVLIVDREGRVRTELQTHRLERLLEPARVDRDHHVFMDSGSLVALATRRLGGIGFFLRDDRSIWTFVDGRPLVIRRGEHWTVFPVWLANALADAIGGGDAIDLVVQAALIISVRPKGAILAIVDDPSALDGMVAAKDRFDLRNQFDPSAMRPETLLHHLIDASDIDAQTLVRLAELDGATIVDRHGQLLAYGAIVSSTDSQHEGARTAAARSLSHRALAVLKVSEDGEITVFRSGELAATLLRSRPTTV